METTTMNTPNSTTPAANVQSAVSDLDAQIAAKMTAMRELTQRNQIRPAATQTATGPDNAAAESGSVATQSDNSDAEVADTTTELAEDSTESVSAQESDPVSPADSDSTREELIDFLEFTRDNPRAKFKFIRNGEEVIIDAKKAAAILGQGSAIHEDARRLKIERAEFDEYQREARQQQDNLLLAMEFTVQPKLQKAYDEIVKVQGWQSTFQQQLGRTKDPAERARIEASMQQNEQYIRQQQKTIGRLRPQLDQYRQIRSQQVQEALTHSRRNFSDKELKNEFVYNEIRSKLEQAWPHSKLESIPGISNIDLVSADETLMGLIRDGLRYRDRPQTRSAGASIATLTQRKGSSPQKTPEDDFSRLREQAKKGGKEGIQAADNLLVQRLQSIRSSRGVR